MPLHRQLPPFLFGGLVGCVFGLMLTSDCLQMAFRRLIRLRDTLICRHSDILYEGTTVVGRSRGRARRLHSLSPSIHGLLYIAADVALLPEPETDGHHTWTVEEIQKYIRRHPIGTKAYLVLMLFLLTGQRISDVVKLGKQHIRKPEHVSELLRQTHPGRWLSFTQHKNRKKAPVTLTIPMLPALETVIELSPCGSLTFIETEFKKPHTTKGLGNWFADRCVEADVLGRAARPAEGGRDHRGRERRDAVSAHGDLRLEDSGTGRTLHQKGPPTAHGGRLDAPDRVRSDRERM